ncbi:MAG: hypothetical protein Q4E62_04440 [Sutterellaceae bacterium]|nr:hypothetical protein [Sutterellaceae bacterium]
MFEFFDVLTKLFVMLSYVTVIVGFIASFILTGGLLCLVLPAMAIQYKENPKTKFKKETLLLIGWSLATIGVFFLPFIVGNLFGVNPPSAKAEGL